MKSPIIEVKQQNLTVLTEFEGAFSGASVKTRHNMRENKILYVIDSNGDLWSFTFVRTNHSGIRKIFSAVVWNISHDHYTYAKEPGISVERFREIVEPHQRDLDPDLSELATSLFESIAICDSSDPLRNHMHLLNL